MKLDWIKLSILALVLLTFLQASDLKSLRFSLSKARRTKREWFLDLSNLAVQMICLPVLEFTLLGKLFHFLIPSLQGSIHGNIWASVIIFCIIDYAWYWNHRAFHANSPYWMLHAVHHEVRHLDVFATSRNSLWSPIVKTYFWLTPLAVFLLDDPRIFLSISGFGLFVAFWTHTEFDLARDSLFSSKFKKVLNLFLIQPEDHFWHHSTHKSHTNFGNVLNVWDKLHGTWYKPNEKPAEFGFELELPFWKKLIFPF